MPRKRSDGEAAWAPADLVNDPEGRARRSPGRQPGEAPGIVGLLIFLGILVGVGVIVWQLVAFLR